MLPPVDETVLQSNPGFASLYATLTSAILNPDGSTKNDPAAKERDAVREELKKHRLKTAKRQLLIHAISTVVPAEQSKPVTVGPSARRIKPASGGTMAVPTTHAKEPSPTSLPPALLDLLVLLAPLLQPNPPLPQESLRLLLANPPFSDLPVLLPSLADLTSRSLRASAVHLARLANPSTNPSFLHRAVSSLPAHVANLTARIHSTTSSLSDSRLAASASLAALLTAQASATAAMLRFLEAKHGAAARSLELRATETALLAARQGVAVEGALRAARRDVYGADGGREAQDALAAYARHLRDGRLRLGEAIRTLRGQLAAYGVVVRDEDEGGGDGTVEGNAEGGSDGAKGRTMREMARVYLEMTRQIEEVRADLERLGMDA